MIPAGFITAVVAWAKGNDARIAQVSAQCDALAAQVLDGTKPVLANASINGVNFGFANPNVLINMSPEERFDALTQALRVLGVLGADTAPVTMTYGSFNSIQR